MQANYRQFIDGSGKAPVTCSRFSASIHLPTPSALSHGLRLLDPTIPFSRSTSLSTAAEPEIIAEPPYGERSTVGQAADPEVVAKLTGHSVAQVEEYRKNGRI
jgi:hypothetical protein